MTARAETPGTASDRTVSDQPAEPAAGARIGFRLLAISPGRAHLGAAERDALLRWLEAMATHLPHAAVQIREKGLDDRGLHRLASGARAAFPGILLINGRADLAEAAGADGVHLTSTGPPTRRIVDRFGGALIVGRSVHRLDELAGAGAGGADYVCLGPAFATPSKPGARPLELADYREAARGGIPVLALGGIDDPARAAAVLRAGAWGIAGIRLFRDPERARARLERLTGAPNSGADGHEDARESLLRSPA